MSRLVHDAAGNRPRASWVRDIALALLVAAAGPAVATYGPAWAGMAQTYVEPDRSALRAGLQNGDARDLATIYADRHYAPIWFADGKLRPEARKVLDLLNTAADDGLDPGRYQARDLETIVAKPLSPAQIAATDVGLSAAYGDYIADLHTPIADAAMIYTDPQGAPRVFTREAAVAQIAAAHDFAFAITDARRMNPVYLHFRQALAERRAQGVAADPLILANLERARALPVDMGSRFVFVDVPAGELRLYDDGKFVDSMKVVVGKRASPTPVMAGLIRYAAFNPYWNIPPDLTRNTYAPRILGNPSTISTLGLEALVDEVPVYDPATLDWQAVADGRVTVRLRQKPGPTNMMGAMKFMLPNNLGIYLHDTPNKMAFEQSDRALSAGCVRLQDAPRLARWLFGIAPILKGQAEERIDLPQPVPVYITYFTAAPDAASEWAARRDIYGRDKALLASLRTRAAA